MSAFVDSFVIISHPISFVKRFFKTFLKFFHPLVTLDLSDLFIVSHQIPLVKWFFNFFEVFSTARRLPLCSLPFVRQLRYYITQPTLCQLLFVKFFRFGGLSAFIQQIPFPIVHILQNR